MLLSFIIITLKVLVLSGLIYIGSYFALKGDKNKVGLYLFLAAIVQFVITFAFTYLMMPMLNTAFSYIWNNIAMSIIAGIAVYIVSIAEPMEIKGGYRESTLWFIPASLLLLSVLMIITMRVAEIKVIDDEFDSIDVEVVDESEELKSTEETKVALSALTAKSKMSKMMSVVPNSNAYDLGTITAQTINGEYVYVASLEFDSFWKWNKFGSVPGYFKINATDINAQPEFVPVDMVYTPAAFLGDDASRNLYAKYPSYRQVGGVNLEVDDEGNPYYIQTLASIKGAAREYNYSEYKVAMINAVSGEMSIHKASESPEWVSAPITSAAAARINNHYGQYEKGWWNSLFAKEGVKSPTGNGLYSGRVTPLVNKDGDLMYFTDFSSDKSEQNSALGYSLINARTGKMLYYKDDTGMADSTTAVNVSNTIYNEKKWTGSMPIMYNIEGTPTWVVTLLDSNKLFKRYVYISALNPDIVADGVDAEKTLEAYKLRLSTGKANAGDTDGVVEVDKAGTVSRVNKLANADNTVTITFTVEGDDTLFIATDKVNPKLVLLEVGDAVTMKVNENNEMTNSVTEIEFELE